MVDHVLVEAVEQKGLLTINNSFEDRKTAKKHKLEKFLTFGLRFINLIFATLYYYFFPYLVNFVPYFFAGDPA